MKLYDYLRLVPDEEEITVFDKEYDTEVYFYGNCESRNDKWQNLMLQLAKELTIKEITSRGVTVNLSNIIEKNLEKIKDKELFAECNIDYIMNDIEYILAGNVSVERMERFVNCLRK